MSASTPISEGDLQGEQLGWILDTSFLARLSPREREETLATCSWHSYPAGEYLTRVGQAVSGADLIVSGQAVVYATDKAGDVVPTAHVGPGMLIGEMELASGGAAAFDVRVSCRTHTLFVPAETFQRLYRNVKAFRRTIDGLVALRTRWAELVSLLSGNRYLRMLGRDDVERLLSSAEIVSPGRNKRLLKARELGEELYVVVKGSVDVLQPSDGATPPRLLKHYGVGELVGYSATLLHTPRMADVVTAPNGHTDLLRIEATTFIDVVNRNPLVLRQIEGSLISMQIAAAKSLKRVEHRLVIFVCGASKKIGATTVAYGLAGALLDAGPVTLIDLDGDETRRKLGLGLKPLTIGKEKTHQMVVPPAWAVRVLVPSSNEQALALVRTLREQRDPEAVGTSKSVIVVSGHFREDDHAYTTPVLPVARHATDLADILVHVRWADQTLEDLPSKRGQIRIQAIRPAKGEAMPLVTSRRSARLLDDPRAFEAFWKRGSLAAIADADTPAGRTSRRLARLVRGRSVGVALGGGGAFGYAHLGLLRVLSAGAPERGLPPLPIDYVSGASFGSLAGALFVGGGLPALEQLERRGVELLAYCTGAMLWPSLFARFVDGVTGKKLLCETEIPFYPVGLDLTTGREYVVSHGTLGFAVQSASCIPGVYPSLRIGSTRLVDGGLVNNVPVSTLWDAGADFILGSNIVPPNAESGKTPFGNTPLGRLPLIGAAARVDDTLRALYGLMSQLGRDRSALADTLFDLRLEGFGIQDFQKGAQIAEQGRQQALGLLDDIHAAYRTDGNIRF